MMTIRPGPLCVICAIIATRSIMAHSWRTVRCPSRDRRPQERRGGQALSRNQVCAAAVQVDLVAHRRLQGPEHRAGHDLFHGLASAERSVHGMFYHRYKESTSQWPYVHNFSFYLRKDIAGLLWNYADQVPPQTQVEDEYEKKFVQLTATRVIGGIEGKRERSI